MDIRLYVEINITCIFILGLIFVKLYGNISLQTDKRLFSNVLICAAVLFSLDVMWAFLDSYLRASSRPVIWLVNILYMSMTGVLGHGWLLYTEYNLYPERICNRKRRIVFALPMLLLIMITISSVWTKWVFYIDEQNVYQRGTLYGMQMLLGYGYIIWGAVRALPMALRESNYEKKRRDYTLASFVILPLTGGLLQVCFPGLPSLCVGITLSLLMIFMSFQENQISLDPLTLLNNRNQLHKYLSSRMAAGNSKAKLYLLMIDVDEFKQINDKYGHIAGDSALIDVARLLKSACEKRNCFIARYGGDEFVIIEECESETEIHMLKQYIQKLLDLTNREQTYKISLSIGYARYREDMATMQQFITAADKELYQVKKNRYKKEK